MMTPEQVVAYLDGRSDAHATSGDAQTSAVYDVGARLAELMISLHNAPGFGWSVGPDGKMRRDHTS